MLHHNIPGAVDSHAHIFDPAFAFSAARHYTPGRAVVEDYEKAAAAWGTERVVLVQPSPYGTDNSALLAALKALGARRARGIAVVDPGVSRTQLQDLRSEGVVGVRLNLEADPASGSAGFARAFESLVDGVSDEGLVVEAFVDCAALEHVADLVAAAPVPVILDHFAGAKASRGADQPGLDAVIELLAAGRIWVKLSGPYRACPDEALLPVLGEVAARLAGANEDRLVWGSDWPHTGGGKDRAARPITDVEPFRAHDAAAFLGQALTWLPSDTCRSKLLVANPAALFTFDTPA